MAFMFKKGIVTGVSITPDIGIEVAQVDFNSRTVIKYGSRPLAYDNVRKEIADLDIFKETLQDMLLELEIPKGSDIALNLPATLFKVTDFPASLTNSQISMAIEEELSKHPVFQNNDPCVSYVKLANSTIQFNKIAYTAAQKTMLIEIAMQIQEIGYNLVNIDTSVNSTLNGLIYNERVNTAPDSNWVLLIVENNYCRIIPMLGKNYVDCFEEKISIGEVLGDAENYSTIVNAVSPILKNLPSQCLYVVSKTNIISAKILADQLKYNAPIVHQEANIFSSEPFLNTTENIPAEIAKAISLDVIGAAINADFEMYSSAYFNLFNDSLGDIYTMSQPPVLKIGSTKIVMSLEKMIKYGIIAAAIVILATLVILIPLNQNLKNKKDEIDDLTAKIASISQFLKQNENISSDLFDEGDEIRMGLIDNKNIYSYYTIVGTEIPKKLWLTSLDFGKNITIKGQADNLESIYSFFRNIKDYNPTSGIKLQKLGLAVNKNKKSITDFDTDSVLTSMNADYYEFVISDAAESVEADESEGSDDTSKDNNKKSSKKKNNSQLPAGLEPIE